MAYATAHLKNAHTGQLKNAPIGFSWTTLFFGFFPSLFRGDWKWFAIILIVALVTMGLSNFVFMFIYNKLSLKDLLMGGYRITGLSGTTHEALSHHLGFDLSDKQLIEEASS